MGCGAGVIYTRNTFGRLERSRCRGYLSGQSHAPILLPGGCLTVAAGLSSQDAARRSKIRRSAEVVVVAESFSDGAAGAGADVASEIAGAVIVVAAAQSGGVSASAATTWVLAAHLPCWAAASAAAKRRSGRLIAAEGGAVLGWGSMWSLATAPGQRFLLAWTGAAGCYVFLWVAVTRLVNPSAAAIVAGVWPLFMIWFLRTGRRRAGLADRRRLPAPLQAGLAAAAAAGLCVVAASLTEPGAGLFVRPRLLAGVGSAALLGVFIGSTLSASVLYADRVSSRLHGPPGRGSDADLSPVRAVQTLSVTGLGVCLANMPMIAAAAGYTLISGSGFGGRGWAGPAGAAAAGAVFGLGAVGMRWANIVWRMPSQNMAAVLGPVGSAAALAVFIPDSTAIPRPWAFLAGAAIIAATTAALRAAVRSG